MDLACTQHVDQPARARCVECGNLLCETCRAKIGGRNFCRPCLPAKLKRRLPGRRSPVFATMLSVVPGLGQMFVGEKLRGLVFGASAIALSNVHPAPSATIALFLYVYNLFDAWSLATERNARVAGETLSASDRRQRFMFSAFAMVTAIFAIARESIAPDLRVDVLWPTALGLVVLHHLMDRKEDRKDRYSNAKAPANDRAKEDARVEPA